MKTSLKILLAAVLLTLSPRLPAGTVAGLVTDVSGKPVAGATVEYWRTGENPFQSGDPDLQTQITTGANGGYEFQVPRPDGFLLARKPGLAPAWRQISGGFNRQTPPETNLVMTVPGTLAGQVLDESNRPVAGAGVQVALAIGEASLVEQPRAFDFVAGKPVRDLFAAHTDATGHFHIDNFPTNAGAILDALAPGKALQPAAQEGSDWISAACRPGQAGIKLILEAAGTVEGEISGDSQAPPVVQLRLQSTGNSFAGIGHEPVRAGADGSFRFENVAAGSYLVQTVFGTNASEWVAEPVSVSVEAGQATHGARVTVQHGTLLEVSLLGSPDHRPQANINVNAFSPKFQKTASSDSQGVARLYLLPGSYQVVAFQESLPASQGNVTVEAGATNRLELEMIAPKKITGIVRQPDGQPAAGLPVHMVGAFGRGITDVKTDAAGQFSLDWNVRQFPGQINSGACVLVRDVDHNLAVAQEVDEDAGSLDLKLAPALTLAGRAEADGKPITNATAQLVFWTGNRGSWIQGLARTNIPGRFEIPALPPGRKYGVVVTAPGYGQKQNHSLEISDSPGRQELDPVELLPANLKLAGQVLDAEDKPVAGCYVNLNGDDQPNAQTRTDKLGRFSFAHVCAGSVRLNANHDSTFGTVSAEGGDTNVVLQLGQNSSFSSGEQAHKLNGVITDPEGKPDPGAQASVFPRNGNDRWSKAGPNGDYRLAWSIQSWQLQNGGARLVARDLARNLAAVEELPEETTNLDLKLKPAITLAGLVNNAAGTPMPGAEVRLLFKAGRSYEQMEEPAKPADAQGRYQIKCLPADGEYLVEASAPGHGQSQQDVTPDSDTNRLELPPLVLKLADQIIAGQVLKDDDKPAVGVNVSMNGEGQPNGNLTTDGQGRFHFRVCEGQIRLFAYSQSGGGNAQATAAAGDTNIVMTLANNPGVRQAPHRASLKGGPLPELASVNLTAADAPIGQSVLLCLFDAAQRPSRHVLQQLAQQSAALRLNNVCVIAVQSTVIPDAAFTDWKNASPVGFPVGRVTEKNGKNQWASQLSVVPWLILANASHQVVAEGFPLADLDAQIQKLGQ